METIFEKQTPVNATLKVQLNESDYAQSVDKKIKDYARKAAIKGFRPGKVPVGYIKKLYGKSLLVDEVLKMVSDEVNRYIRENELPIVGDPMPDEAAKNIDWDNTKDYEFNYEVGLATDFDASIDKLPAIKQYDINPAAERVEEAIEDVKKRFGNDSEPETSEMGDLVFGGLKQEETEFFFQSGVPTNKVNEDRQSLFIGVKKGDVIKFDIQSIFATDKDLGFATGKSDEEAAALNGEFEFTVEKLTRVLPSEMNQELFDKVLGEGKADSEETFRTEVVKIMKENYARESDALLGYEVEKLLIENIKIDLPDDYLKRWLIAVNEGKFTEEEVEKDYEAFARGLRLDLIRSEIAKKHEVKVEYDDVLEIVKNEIRGYFGGQDFGGTEEFVDEMAREQLQKNEDGVFQKHFNRAFGEKVLGYIKENIAKDVQEVSVDEFNVVAKSAYDGIQQEIDTPTEA
jgi:trigger factor